MTLDEPFDHRVSRPVARFLAPRLRAAGLGADQVSLLALAFGVSSGWCIASGGRWPALGGALLLAMVVLDCTDGEVARLGPPSDKPWRGRLFDGFADLGTVLSVHVGMAMHVADGQPWGRHHPSGLDASGLFVLAFASFVWKSSVLDDVKQRLKPSSIDAELPAYLAATRGRLERLLLWLFICYARQASRLAGDGRPASPELFRQLAWIGPTHHLAAIAAAGLLTPLVPHAFLVYAMATLIPANAFLVWVLGRAGRAPTL